jgi:hypothetical protein
MTSAIRFHTLFHGPITTDADAYQPRLELILEPGKGPAKKPMDWGRLLHRISLFHLSSIAIHEGEVRIRDQSASPDVELSAEQVDMEAENLFRGGGDTAAWASFACKGLFMGSGRFALKTRFSPESGKPVFDFDFSLRHMDLKAMNRALQAYTGMSVQKGRLDLDAHATGSGGRYKGRIHSALHDFGLMKSPEKEKGIVKAIGEKATRIAGEILEWKTEKNEAAGQAPPKMGFSGEFPAEVDNAWSMSEFLLKEAFRKGMRP